MAMNMQQTVRMARDVALDLLEETIRHQSAEWKEPFQPGGTVRPITHRQCPEVFVPKGHFALDSKCDGREITFNFTVGDHQPRRKL